MYSKCEPEVQKKLDKTREKEWSKWQDFSAAVVIDKAQLEELLAEGHKVIRYPDAMGRGRQTSECWTRLYHQNKSRDWWSEGS